MATSKDPIRARWDKRATDRDVCLSCLTKDCMRGGEKGFGGADVRVVTAALVLASGLAATWLYVLINAAG